jgi:uncharacterized protein (DUF58 family)
MVNVSKHLATISLGFSSHCKRNGNSEFQAMLKSVLVLLVIGVVVACLVGLGVGATALVGLVLALCVMSGIALLIALPFLKRTEPEQSHTEAGEH